MHIHSLYMDKYARVITGRILSCFSAVKWQDKKKRDGLFRLSHVALAKPKITVDFGHIHTGVPVKPVKDFYVVNHIQQKEIFVFGVVDIDEAAFFDNAGSVGTDTDNSIVLLDFIVHFFKPLSKICI